MFPTHPAMLDAAAPEAAVKPKPIAADGDVTNAPKVHSLARIATCVRCALLLTGGSEARWRAGEAQPMLNPTASGQNDSNPYKFRRIWVALDALTIH